MLMPQTSSQKAIPKKKKSMLWNELKFVKSILVRLLMINVLRTFPVYFRSLSSVVSEFMEPVIIAFKNDFVADCWQLQAITRLKEVSIKSIKQLLMSFVFQLPIPTRQARVWLKSCKYFFIYRPGIQLIKCICDGLLKKIYVSTI